MRTRGTAASGTRLWNVSCQANIYPEYETLLSNRGGSHLPPLTPPQPPRPLHTRMVLRGTFSGSSELWFCPRFWGMNISWSEFRGLYSYTEWWRRWLVITYYSVFARIFLRKQAPWSIFWVRWGLHTPCLHEVWKILWYHVIWALRFQVSTICFCRGRDSFEPFAKGS